MEEKAILRDIADTIVDKPETFRVAIRHPNWWQKFLIKVGIIKPYVDFKIKPLTLGKIVAISKLTLGLELDDFEAILKQWFKGKGDKKKMVEQKSLAVATSMIIMFEILAIVLCKGKRPSKKLIDFLAENVSDSEFGIANKIIERQTDLSGFITGIISIKGLNVLEMNPKTEEETNKASTTTSAQ